MTKTVLITGRLSAMGKDIAVYFAQKNYDSAVAIRNLARDGIDLAIRR